MLNSLNIAVTCTSQKLQEAKQLAEQLHLPFIDEETHLADHYDYLLLLTPEYLGLSSKKNKKPFYIDFLSGKLRHRISQAGLQKEALAKAIGLSPQKHPRIIDATAGLGRDSYMLATLGYHVIMLERSAILHALLVDAFKRAKKDPKACLILEKLELIHADALFWIKNEQSHPDIVYLDPMFSERKKSASVKKEMVILRDLLGTDQDKEQLFELALACATYKVVVKRPRLAVNIVTQPKPNYSITGQSSRFDVYLIPKK